MEDAIIEKLDLDIEILEGMEKEAPLTPYYTGRLHGFREARELVKKCFISDVVKRSFIAKDKDGNVRFDGLASTREESIQKAYDQYGNRATEWEYSWV